MADPNDQPLNDEAPVAECYLGHTHQYWVDTGINLMTAWMPAVLFLAVLMLIIRFNQKRQKAYYAKYEQSMATQQKAFEEIQRTNSLLAEILKSLSGNKLH